MRYLALLLIGWLCLPVNASTQVDIFRAEVAIDSEQQDGESLARQQGMQEVIVRATGDASSLSNPVVKKALGSSARYVSQMSYGQLDDQSSLKMLFNSGQIRSLLTQAKLPYWSPNRSNILVWMIEEQHYDRSITWERSESDKLAELHKATTLRGLPVIIPVGDFDDVTGVNVSDLWGGFIEPISQASQRYPADSVLVVRARNDQLRWTLYDQQPTSIVGSHQSPQSGTASGNEAISEMVDAIADYYANKNAVVVSNESSQAITVKVLNINTARDFFVLEQRLIGLNSVASTEINRVQGNEVTLKVHLLASQQAFEHEAAAIAELGVLADPLGEEEFAPAPVPMAETSVVAEPVAAVEPEPLDTTAQQDQPLEKMAEPVVTPPVKDRVDLIYEWSASALRS
ncbi:DUF2066 domain-containing protein [Vibrio sp. CAU 1672]|uniref:DUF2066 domain-containing protein n=1 Tax=Vibrio sp. CAU 1672 TaxID=3032594 RepID=UPI0023DA6E08|nr:DUF2066 domain-containing protein [Vibrio sp. CAU 1672]MDF2155506.1 DUF2066 domain-containing protein [Vibrio sp. CAU 1672]